MSVPTAMSRVFAGIWNCFSRLLYHLPCQKVASLSAILAERKPGASVRPFGCLTASFEALGAAWKSPEFRADRPSPAQACCGIAVSGKSDVSHVNFFDNAGREILQLSEIFLMCATSGGA